MTIKPAYEEADSPLPGYDDARFQLTRLKKQMEQESKNSPDSESARDSLWNTEPVDKDLLISEDTVLKNRTVLNNEPVSESRTDPKSRTVLKNRTVLKTETVLKNRTGDAVSTLGNSQRIIDDSGVVTITENYMRFDMDIFRVLTDMGLTERFVYLDLIRRSYGKYPKPVNFCYCTHPEIVDTTGIAGKDSITRAIKALEKKGFLSRWYQAQKKGEKSLYRVYLPCELVGYGGRTRINISKGNKDR
jgi:hypothetical protein